MQLSHDTEILVIGGGAVGCSIALQLAQRGKDVTLVDKAEPGAGTSTKNFGLVWVHSKEPYSYMELNLRSSRLWPAWADGLGEDVDLRQGGGLVLCFTEDELEKKAAMHQRQRQSSAYEGRMLTPQEVFDMQPGVSKEIAGASWSPHDGDVNFVKYSHALARACERAGVRMQSRTEVTAIHRDEQNQVTSVDTNQGMIRTHALVNAAGPWAGKVAALADHYIELSPQRGQVLMTESTEMICPTPMSKTRQEPHGQFLMGATSEDVGFDWSTTQEGFRQIWENAVRMVPATRDLRVVRHFSGLRPMPQDGMPILGAVPRIPGYYIAASHSGITLSPLHGQVIADLICEGETEIPIDSYDPMRFETKPKAAERQRS